MGDTEKREGKAILGSRWGWVLLVCLVALAAGVWWIHRVQPGPSPQVYVLLDLFQDLVALTLLANVLLRFKATRDTVSVALAIGFVLAAVVETAASVPFFTGLDVEVAGAPRLPMGWMVGHSLLAAFLLAASSAERRLRDSRSPVRSLLACFGIAAGFAAVVGLVYQLAPGESPVRPDAWIPRPWQLLPAGLFLAAVISLRRRRTITPSAFETALSRAAWMNLVAHLLASQSLNPLGTTFLLAEMLNVSSFAVVLVGALSDNALLYDRIEYLAVSDPLTGLANYRRFVAVLNAEIERSARTRRTFSVVLLDLDGLKDINDRYGHLAGGQALCRVGEVLRVHCRAMDTAARFGGDEFALVLPETDTPAALGVAARICERVTLDGLQPPLSVSAGTATYPADGKSLESLLEAADRALYAMKQTGQLAPQPGHAPAGQNGGPGPAAKPARATVPFFPGVHELQVVFDRNARAYTATGKFPATVEYLTLGGESMPTSYAITRIEQRLPMEVAVQLYGHPNLPGVETTFTENVSACGARVVTMHRWKANDCVWISLLPGGFRSRARVAYCQSLRDAGFAIGLEFLQPSGRWVVDRHQQAAARP